MKWYLIGFVFLGAILTQSSWASKLPGVSDSQAALNEAANIIKSHEGYVAHAYLDPVGVPTIGWGTTRINGRPVQMGETLSEQEAKALLIQDMASAEKALRESVKPEILDKLNDVQKAVLISFIYNVGEGAFKQSTFLNKLNEGNIDAAANEMNRWVYGDGRVLPGLVTRRKEEAEILRSGVK